MRGHIQLPQPMKETGALRDEKRKFNLLLAAVQRLIPTNAGNEVVELTSLGTVRRSKGGSGANDDAIEGRWL